MGGDGDSGFGSAFGIGTGISLAGTLLDGGSSASQARRQADQISDAQTSQLEFLKQISKAARRSGIGRELNQTLGGLASGEDLASQVIGGQVSGAQQAGDIQAQQLGSALGRAGAGGTVAAGALGDIRGDTARQIAGIQSQEGVLTQNFDIQKSQAQQAGLATLFPGVNSATQGIAENLGTAVLTPQTQSFGNQLGDVGSALQTASLFQLLSGRGSVQDQNPIF